MVIEKNVSENGKNTTWRVPSWFVSICTAIGILWITWISASMVFCLSQFSKGERNTKSEGIARDLKINANKYAIAALEIPPNWFKSEVQKNGEKIDKNSDAIAANHRLITEAIVEIRLLPNRKNN